MVFFAESSAPERRFRPCRGSTRTFCGALVLFGAAFGGWYAGNAGSSASGAVSWPLEVEQALAASPAGDYAFLPYRRDVWIVCHSKGTAQFFASPESTSAEHPPIKSQVYKLDPAIFPQDQVQFSISERNLLNYLWVLNPVTGKARFVRARRDGGFDESPVIDASKDL